MANVRDVMTAAPERVAPDTQVAEAAKTMRDQNIGLLLVTEGDHRRRRQARRRRLTRRPGRGP